MSHSIRDYLDMCESAPSALALVKAVSLGRFLTDHEIDHIYSLAESDCDAEVQQLLPSLTKDQTIELYDTALEALLEKVDAE